MKIQNNIYQDALDQSDIILEDLNDILNKSLLIGNGDINALVYQENDKIVLNLTKNGVWDARLDTSQDPPLVSTRELKERIKAINAGTKDEDINVIMQEPNASRDSYHIYSYPCPRLCGKLYVDLKVDNTLQKRFHRLSLLQGMIQSFIASEPTTIFAYANSNVFVISQPNTEINVYLEPINDEEMLLAEKGEDDKILWLMQKIPGDLDIKPLTFAVAVYIGESKEGFITISIVTTNESKNHGGQIFGVNPVFN